MIVERALLPGHGLDGARHGRRLERGRSIRMEGVADGVDGGEGPLGGQGESVLMLRLQWGGHNGIVSVKLARTENMIREKYTNIVQKKTSEILVKMCFTGKAEGGYLLTKQTHTEIETTWITGPHTSKQHRL